MHKLIYLDNAATSFPKPPQVQEAMLHYMNEVGANPGRAGHKLSIQASSIVQSARENIAALFNIRDPSRIVFTLNVTEALNTVICGYVNPGDHVLTTSMEHNSVMRPLKHLESSGAITLTTAPCDHKGFLKIDEFKNLIQPETALVVVNHASNVCGTIQNLKNVKEAVGSIPMLVDAAQTAGCFPIDVEADAIDFLAFTGHKGMLGPQGTGGFYIREGLTVRPLKRGGTGSISEALEQPDFLPDALESGTQNNIGIAGLGAAVEFILKQGVEKIRKHETALTADFLKRLHHVAGLTIYGPLNAELQTATLSVTFDSIMPMDDEPGFTGCGSINLAWMEEGVPVGEAGERLDSEHDILVRVGLHCAPMAHRTLGTYPDGTVRLSMGYFNTPEDVAFAAEAIKKILL
jgi:cysteine desulfurase/selenocysteine lyase